jgi:hypothetical protein
MKRPSRHPCCKRRQIARARPETRLQVITVLNDMQEMKLRLKPVRQVRYVRCGGSALIRKIYGE